MSDQAQSSKSNLPTWKDLPTFTDIYRNIDVSNVCDQGFTSTTPGQNVALSSAEDIVSFKMDFSIEFNPIGPLQELCVARHHPIPIYTCFDKDSNEQDPMFNVECLVRPYFFSGTASSKREAKKKAAYEMYKQIEKLTPEDVSFHQDPFHNIVSSLRQESVTLLKYYFGSTDAPKTPHLQSIKKNSNECKLTAADTLKIISERGNLNVEFNPINSLQDLCLTCHFPLPIYTFTTVDDSEKHRPIFKMKCSVPPHSSSGIASNKKATKRKAAYEMYKQILASEEVHAIIDNDCKYKDASAKIGSSLCHESENQLKSHFGSTDAPKTPYLQSIMKKSNECKLTAVDTLQRISERENFTTSCMVTPRNSDGVTVMIQANILPLIVFSAIRKNENDAKEAAAHFFLSCLKLKLRI